MRLSHNLFEDVLNDRYRDLRPPLPKNNGFITLISSSIVLQTIYNEFKELK